MLVFDLTCTPDVSPCPIPPGIFRHLTCFIIKMPGMISFALHMYGLGQTQIDFQAILIQLKSQKLDNIFHRTIFTQRGSDDCHFFSLVTLPKICAAVGRMNHE